MHGGDVEREPGQFRRRGHHVGANHPPAAADRDIGEMLAAAHLLAEDVEPPRLDRGHEVRRRGVYTDLVEVIVVTGVRVRVGQGQHRAAPEIQHRSQLLIHRTDPQDRQPGRTAPRPGPVLPQPDDLRGGGQRVGDRREPAEHETPVEQVGPHVLRRQRRLPDRDIPHQRGMSNRPPPGHGASQAVVQGQPQPIAHDRLVHRRVPAAQRDRRRGVEHVPDRQVLEVRTLRRDERAGSPRRRPAAAHRSAPPCLSPLPVTDHYWPYIIFRAGRCAAGTGDPGAGDPGVKHGRSRCGPALARVGSCGWNRPPRRWPGGRTTMCRVPRTSTWRSAHCSTRWLSRSPPGRTIWWHCRPGCRTRRAGRRSGTSWISTTCTWSPPPTSAWCASPRRWPSAGTPAPTWRELG